MGRLYQLFGVIAVYCVFNYVYTECKGLRYRNALRLVLLTTMIFVFIGYKDMSMPMLTYLLIGLIGLPAVAYGVIYDPEVLLIVAATYIPFNLLLPADFGGIQQALNGTNIVLIALILGWIFGKNKYSPASMGRNPAMYFVIMFVLFSIVAYVRGGIFHGEAYFLGMIFPLKRWLTPMILFAIFFRLANNRGIIKIIFSVLMLIIISNIFFGLLEWVEIGFATYSERKHRLGGFNMHPNFYGSFISYYVCVLIGPFLTGIRKTTGKFLIIPVLLGFRMILPTNSRGAWIGLPPALLTTAFFYKKRFFLLAICIFLLPTAFPVLMPDTVRMRFYEAVRPSENKVIYEESTITQDLSSTKSVSVNTRYRLILAGYKLIKENLWFGVGWGVFPYVIGNYDPSLHRASAHNMFLQMISEMGLSTVIILLVMLFLFFKAGIYVVRHEKDTMLKGVSLGYIASIPAIIACNLTGNRLDAVDLIAIFWMLSACVLRLRQIIKAERLQEQYRV